MKNEQKILKWLNNELPEREVADLKKSEDSKTLEKIVHYATQLEAPKVDANKSWDAFKKKELGKKETKVINLQFKSFLRIAAMAIIMLGASYFLFFNNDKSFETQIAETEILILPDNSEVILNAASKLSYNKKNWKTERQLELDGEAFFKVSKGQKFTVNTEIGSVQVLGTQFNVKERDNYFEVQCYEGIVAVTYKEEKVKLTFGKTFRIINDKVILVDDFNAKSPSWLEAESSFAQVPLSQVISELEIQYDIKVTTKDVDSTQLFTGTFTHKNINVALEAISIPLKLSYKIEGNNVTLYKYGEQ